jgi:putative acetyltransferase
MAGDIVVRRAEPGDCEAVCAIFENDRAYSGTLQLPHPSREAWRKRMAEVPEGHYMLVACVDGKIVGHGGLHPADKSPRRAHVMSVGLAVADPWHGRGVGSALVKALVDLADDWMNVIRLELTVFADNAAAIALYRKFGFEIEGTHKAYALRSGEYVDAHAMARVRAKKAPPSAP